MSYQSFYRRLLRCARPIALFSCVLFTLACIGVSDARATTIQDIARIKGQGEVILQGLGLVTGLNGTGDPGSELVLARPLMELYRRNANPIGTIDELEASRSVALVMVTCVVPATGAKTDDKLDVRVAALHSATSLRGGTLYIAPLSLPVVNGISNPFAFAQGNLVLTDPETPTGGLVRMGARIARDIDTTPPITGAFDLVIDQHFATWEALSTIVGTLNEEYRSGILGISASLSVGVSATPIAEMLDARTIRIRVPEQHRGGIPSFVAQIMSLPIHNALLALPARVIVNPELGSIVVTGNVQISAAGVIHGDLLITRTTPEPLPTLQAPLIEQSRVAELGTRLTDSERSKLDDLLAAFKQLNIPVSEQIQLLIMLKKTGRLHAELIIDGM